MEYEIGLIFVDDGDYTNKANWCNANGCYIEEMEPLEDGTRQFQIKAQQHQELRLTAAVSPLEAD